MVRGARLVLHCPHCAAKLEEEMPMNACVVRLSCTACGQAITPLPKDCCVFCSYGERRCPTAPAPDGR